MVGAVFQAEKYDFIYNRIRYRIIRIKSGIKFVVCHNYAKIEVDSCDSLLLENTLILHSVIILFSQFLINKKITTAAIYFLKKVFISYIKTTAASKSLYKL